MLGPFERSRSPRRAVAQLGHLVRLPRPVARFYLRAVLVALRTGDRRSLVGSSRPRELAALLRAAGDRRRAVEIGTGTAWTAIALALAHPGREVVSYDPNDYEERARYLALAPPTVRRRIRLIREPGDGPDAQAAGPADLVFVDSSHELEETRRTVELWRARLAAGGVLALHDYGDPAWPGVAAAAAQLGLRGRAHGHMLLCEAA